jgi:hypothetical protein
MAEREIGIKSIPMRAPASFPARTLVALLARVSVLAQEPVFQTNSMCDAPTYRWLPAKSKIGSTFLMFYARTPDGFRKVDDVVLAGGKVTATDATSGVTVVLVAARPL